MTNKDGIDHPLQANAGLSFLQTLKEYEIITLIYTDIDTDTDTDNFFRITMI